jgi:hypothetical protein
MKTYIFKAAGEPDEDRWSAYCPALLRQGAATWGHTREEARARKVRVLDVPDDYDSDEPELRGRWGLRGGLGSGSGGRRPTSQRPTFRDPAPARIAVRKGEAMTRIRIEDSGAEAEARRLLRTAVESKVARIRLAIAATEARVQTFERRYDVSSADFAARLTAEDLAGGDVEYVEWLGEWRGLQQLREDLQHLEASEYADR